MAAALYDTPHPESMWKQPPVKSLPAFKPLPRNLVEDLARRVLSHDAKGEITYLRELHAYDDGHYRVVFSPAYFTLADSQSEPTRSQWNSLKKKFKRHEPRIFVFKDHSMVPCGAESCCILDVGFFAT